MRDTVQLCRPGGSCWISAIVSTLPEYQKSFETQRDLCCVTIPQTGTCNVQLKVRQRYFRNRWKIYTDS